MAKNVKHINCKNVPSESISSEIRTPKKVLKLGLRSKYKLFAKNELRVLCSHPLKLYIYTLYVLEK